MAKRTAVNEITGQHIEDLTIEIRHLRDELRVHRDVLDEIRSDFQWLVRNLRMADAPRQLQLASMSPDPCDPQDRDPGKQQALWSDDKTTHQSVR